MTKAIELSAPAVEEAIAPGLDAIEKLLQETARGASSQLGDLTTHLSTAGGKRLRPVLALVCAGLGDRPLDNEEVIAAATAIEMTHLASLYHDDVMDSAPSRRGVPSAQQIWGNNRAILAGDLLFSRASLLVSPLGQATVEHYARVFERMCVGQMNETYGPSGEADPVPFYLQVLADKTGALVAAAAYLGAKHAGADAESAELVRQFGEKIGVAFQIADDVLDIASGQEQSGKTPGTDLREGVDTLPILLLRRRLAAGTLDAAGQQILAALREDLMDDTNLANVVQMLRAHDVLEETRQLARDWAADALTYVDQLPDSPVKTALAAFAAAMVDRQV